jgi:two-component system sensor kinase FixL
VLDISNAARSPFVHASEDFDAVLKPISTLLGDAIASLVEGHSLAQTAAPLVRAIEAIPGAGRIAMFLSEAEGGAFACVAAPNLRDEFISYLSRDLRRIVGSRQLEPGEEIEAMSGTERVRVFPLSVPNETPRAVIVTVRDPAGPQVSEQLDLFLDRFAQLAGIVVEDRRLRTRIGQQRAVFEALVGAAPDAIIRIDKHSTILDFLGKAEQIFGYAPADAVGKNVAILMPEPAASLHSSYVENCVVSGRRQLRDFSRPLTARRRDGTIFPVEIGLGQIPGRDTVEFIAIIRDISRRVALETEMTEMRQALELAGRQSALAELAATIAHELNQPLTAIVNYVEALELRLGKLDGVETGPLVELARQAGEQARLGGQVIRRTRQLVTAGASEPVRGDFHSVVAEAARLVATMPGVREVVVNVTAEGAGGEAQFDRVEIQQVVINLAANALKALAGRANGRLDIRSLGEDKTVTLIVTDNGPGIEEADKRQLFERFFRKGGSGMGLGLSVVKRIVDAHHGTIEVSDNPSGGASFRMSLPRAIEADTAGDAHD